MGTLNNITLKNQFGEASINQVVSVDDTFSDLIPPKTGVAALTALATDATLVQAVAQLNALLAALQDDTP